MEEQSSPLEEGANPLILRARKPSKSVAPRVVLLCVGLGMLVALGAAVMLAPNGGSAGSGSNSTAVSLSQCALGAGADGGVANEQRMTLGADGTIRLVADSGLCVCVVHLAGSNTNLLQLAKCPPALPGGAGGAFVWQHLPTGEIVHVGSGECLGAESEASVGTWSCASSGASSQHGQPSQPSQHWAVDADLKMIVSLSTYEAAASTATTAAVGEPATNFAGFCLTASDGGRARGERIQIQGAEGSQGGGGDGGDDRGDNKTHERDLIALNEA